MPPVACSRRKCVGIALLLSLLACTIQAIGSLHYRCPVRCICQRISLNNDSLRLNCSAANYVTMPAVEVESNTVENDAYVVSGVWYDVTLDDNHLFAIDYPKIVWMSLTSLSMRRNRLDYLPNYTFCPSQQLAYLSLAGNNIDVIRTEAFRCLRSLRTLDLSDNNLVDINSDWFVDLISLTTLNLQANRLRTISASTFVPLSSLTSLDLSVNQIAQIYSNAFVGLSNLKALNLSDNTFTTLPCVFGEFTFANVIDISETYIRLMDSTFCFTRINVSTIKINRMPQLILIDAGSFSHLPLLTTLQISHNPKLRYVDADAIKHTPSLRTFDLSYNEISSFGVTADLTYRIRNTSLRVLLEGNVIRCDCSEDGLSLASLPAVTVQCAPTVARQSNRSSCGPEIVGLFDSVYEKTIGDSLELLCRSQPKQHSVYWTFLPNPSDLFPADVKLDQLIATAGKGRDVVSRLPGGVKVNDRGTLSIDFILHEHQGIFTCYVTAPNGQVVVDYMKTEVHVRNVDASIVIMSTSPSSVTVSWRAHLTPYTSYVLAYRAMDIQNATVRIIDIRSLMRSFTVSGLRSMTSYEFCIGLRNTNSILYISCKLVSTKGREYLGHGYMDIKRAVMGGLIGGVCGLVTLACVLSHLIRRYNRRKIMQEQLRGERTSELYLAGIDVISDTAPVTYENTAAVDSFDLLTDDDTNEEGDYLQEATTENYDESCNFDDGGYPQTSAF